MSKTKKSVRKKISILPCSLAIVVVIVVVASILVWRGDRQVHYSIEQQHQFYENELRNILEGCAGGKTPYREINERHQKLSADLVKKFGKHLNVNMVTDYHVLSKHIEMATGVQTNGTPEIAIFVPCVMDMFETVRQKHGDEWRVRFETHFLAIFMHEMEHTPMADVMTGHVDVSEESRAWSETCRNTLRPLASKYRLTLIATEANMMRAWVESGEDTNAPAWNGYVSQLYSGLSKTRPVR